MRHLQDLRTWGSLFWEFSSWLVPEDNNDFPDVELPGIPSILLVAEVVLLYDGSHVPELEHFKTSLSSGLGHVWTRSAISPLSGEHS